MEDIDLICESCSKEYSKPSIYKHYREESENVFFIWSLKFCDSCRKIKESDALGKLPEILKILTK